jgi:hypothetical protein
MLVYLHGNLTLRVKDLMKAIQGVVDGDKNHHSLGHGSHESHHLVIGMMSRKGNLKII